MTSSFEALATGNLSSTPFPHFALRGALGEIDSVALLEWLERDAPWQLKIAEFYQQYEFSLLDVELPPLLEPLFRHERVTVLKSCVERLFDAELAPRHDITVHKLVPGQRIRIHNDFIPGRESHRILVQLNRGWADANGGVLLLFGSDDANDVRKAFRPLHDSCVAFEISPRSHHAVTPVEHGERFTLVYSFYRAEP